MAHDHLECNNTLPGTIKQMTISHKCHKLIKLEKKHYHQDRDLQKDTKYFLKIQHRGTWSYFHVTYVHIFLI